MDRGGDLDDPYHRRRMLGAALMSEDSIISNGIEYTMRTAEEIRDLILERDAHYEAGRTEEGNAVKAKLKYTALKVV
jgi:hypothetical protein